MMTEEYAEVLRGHGYKPSRKLPGCWFDPAGLLMTENAATAGAIELGAAKQADPPEAVRAERWN